MYIPYLCLFGSLVFITYTKHEAQHKLIFNVIVLQTIYSEDHQSNTAKLKAMNPTNSYPVSPTAFATSKEVSTPAFARSVQTTQITSLDCIAFAKSRDIIPPVASRCLSNARR